jgi:hypothetical protein
MVLLTSSVTLVPFESRQIGGILYGARRVIPHRTEGGATSTWQEPGEQQLTRQRKQPEKVE